MHNILLDYRPEQEIMCLFELIYQQNLCVLIHNENIICVYKNYHCCFSFLDNSLSGRPLQTLTINKRAELLYNIGLSLLFAGRPAEAFECLIQAQNIYQTNPRYWLRLAECCIAVHQKVFIVPNYFVAV